MYIYIMFQCLSSVFFSSNLPVEYSAGTVNCLNAFSPRRLFLRQRTRIAIKCIITSVCTKYINHIHTVMPTVIERSGGPSGF